MATTAMFVVLAGLLVPFMGASANPLPGARLMAQWSQSYAVATYQETDSRIKYRGAWARGNNTSYLGGSVLFANGRGAKATFKFTGTAISWIGPVGPTRGKANVFLNGRLIKTVDTYASRFKPMQVLFKATFSTMSTRTMVIAVVGTKLHSRVAVDAFMVRGGIVRLPAAPAVRPVANPTAASTAAQPVEPTPTQVPTPTPALTPAPTGNPVPASIDATGASDASAALQSWLGAVPDGSTIVFKAGGTYRMDTGLRVFSGRHDLDFDGNGATLRSNGDATSASSLFSVSGTRIKIHDFKLVGNSPTPGSYRADQEYANGVTTSGAREVEIANVTISAVYGDGLLIGDWSDTVWFHDSKVATAGRNGVDILAGRNITVERVAFDKSGWATFDIEPWEVSGGADNVKFLNNTAGTWNGEWGFFFGASGIAGSVVSNVTVSGNSITGSPLTSYVTLARRQNIVFTNNTSSVIGTGPVLDFAHVDGLIVTGNVQPLKSGVLAKIIDSTGVSYP